MLWLWFRLVATTLIGPLAWEPPCAVGAAQDIATTTTTTAKDKRQKDKKNKKIKKDPRGFDENESQDIDWNDTQKATLVP